MLDIFLFTISCKVTCPTQPPSSPILDRFHQESKECPGLKLTTSSSSAEIKNMWTIVPSKCVVMHRLCSERDVTAIWHRSTVNILIQSTEQLNQVSSVHHYISLESEETPMTFQYLAIV